MQDKAEMKKINVATGFTFAIRVRYGSTLAFLCRLTALVIRTLGNERRASNTTTLI
jgi:hypothetical protein